MRSLRRTRWLAGGAGLALVLVVPSMAAGDALDPLPVKAPTPQDAPRMNHPIPRPSKEPSPVVCAGTSTAGFCVTDEPILIIKEYLVDF